MVVVVGGGEGGMWSAYRGPVQSPARAGGWMNAAASRVDARRLIEASVSV